MMGFLGTGVWIRIAEVALPLVAVLWADTVIEWYWPGVALGARTRWRAAQKRLIEPFLPLDGARPGPVWPLAPMVDAKRFLERPETYMGRMGGLVLVCTAAHYWDRAHGLTVLWALSYVVGTFVLLVLLAAFQVWNRDASQDLS